MALLQTISSQVALAVENIQNQENKLKIVQEMEKLRTDLLNPDNEANYQNLLEHLSLWVSQRTGGVSQTGINKDFIT